MLQHRGRIDPQPSMSAWNNFPVKIHLQRPLLFSRLHLRVMGRALIGTLQERRIFNWSSDYISGHKWSAWDTFRVASWPMMADRLIWCKRWSCLVLLWYFIIYLPWKMRGRAWPQFVQDRIQSDHYNIIIAIKLTRWYQKFRFRSQTETESVNISETWIG